MADFPWTFLATLVDRRIFEELMKRNQGELKAVFAVPMCFIDELDIGTNLRLQDPAGLSQTGAGEEGRYYYVERLDLNFMTHEIMVTAVDLQYLLRQCIILGVCADIPASWMAATEEQRMYGYLCDCALGDDGLFPDGEPCKMLCPCRN